MKPEILASLFGTIVGAVTTIIVELIRSKSKKSDDEPKILVPDGYKTHHPTKSRTWLLILPFMLLGGVTGYFLYTWFHQSVKPQQLQITATASKTPVNTLTATITDVPQPIPLTKNCINGVLWSPFENNASEQKNNCLLLDDWGIFARDNGLAISLTNTSTESIRQGLFISIDKDTQISFKLTISELYTPTANNLANLSLGVVSRSSFDPEKDVLLIYQRESPEPGYPILVKKQERGGIDAYLTQDAGNRKYSKNTTQDILLDVSDTNQLTIYIDGLPVIQNPVTFQDKTFWIGYRLAINALVEAEISEIQIQRK